MTRKQRMSEMQEDLVNKPAHYNMGSIEPIDFIESWQMDFREGAVIKYVTRAPYKGKRLQDLEKARWFLNRLIDDAKEWEDE